MAADIKHHDLFFKYRQRKLYAKAAAQVDRIAALQPPLELVPCFLPAMIYTYGKAMRSPLLMDPGALRLE